MLVCLGQIFYPYHFKMVSAVPGYYILSEVYEYEVSKQEMKIERLSIAFTANGRLKMDHFFLSFV